MKYKILLTACLFSLYPASSFAIQSKSAEDGSEISADISKTEMNRIKIVGDRIRSIKSNAGDLEITQDNKLGELYLRPANFTENKPLNLFIITEQNFTYQLLLYPRSIPSEQILISNDSVVSSTDSEVSKITKAPYQQQIISLIKAMRSKAKISGYQVKSAKKTVDLGDLEMKRLTTYKGQMFIGELFILKNDTDQFINLQENIFFKNGVRAVKIESPDLLPGEVTEIFVIS